jgi:hypothetical protein
MRSIGKDCAGWNMKPAEKHNLLKEVAHTLDRINDP